MSKHDKTLSPPEPNITPQAATRHDGWSLDKQVAFLRALSATHSVSAAADMVGMSRQSAYRLRSRLKGQAFDLAWEVAFHHSYDVLAHAALDRALNGVEVPVYYKGEKIDSYRRFDERLTVTLLKGITLGGNPTFGRLAPMAERQARDFDGLLARIGRGEAVETGALDPEDPGEIELMRSHTSAAYATRNTTRDTMHDAPYSCPSTWSDEELMQALQRDMEERQK